jgi:glycerol-3-phosphate dehydrogenase (NAD(P)+)
MIGMIIGTAFVDAHNTLPQETGLANALIVGYGQMGHALQYLLQERNAVEIWAVTPQQTEIPQNIRNSLPGAELVCMCVPTIAHPILLEQMLPQLPHSSVTLSVAKGVDESCRTTADILAAVCGATHPWGVLCGPMIAHEIVSGKLAYAQTGMHDVEFFNRIQPLFSKSNLHLTYSPYPYAISWCAALKNVYAPLFGVIEELGLGDNVRGRLLIEAVREMNELVEILSSVKDAVYAEAGLADLITTVTSPSSHHRKLGQRVAQGDIQDMQVEGVHTLQVMARMQRITATDFPLFEIAGGLVNQPLQVAGKLHAWLRMMLTM